MTKKVPPYVWLGLLLGLAAFVALLVFRDDVIRIGRQPETVTVVVAKKDLSYGDSVTVPEDLFEYKAFEKGTEPNDAIQDLAKLRNKMLRRRLRAGEGITEDHLFGEGSGGLRSFLPEGHRLMGIRVSDEELAAFAVQPFSRINVVSITKDDDGKAHSQMLLEDVLVVAADVHTHRNPEGAPMPANVVTVAVKAEDALKIALAKTKGAVKIVVRDP